MRFGARYLVIGVHNTVDVREAAREKERIGFRRRLRARELRSARAAHECAAEVGNVPADTRARSAARAPPHEDARALIALLDRDVVQARTRREVGLYDPRDERFGAADVPLDDRRARSRA